MSTQSGEQVAETEVDRVRRHVAQLRHRIKELERTLNQERPAPPKSA